MKVLWITNILFPEVCEELGLKASVLGGWMHSSAISLLGLKTDLNLAIVSLYSGKELKIITKKDFTFYLIPQGKDNKKYDKVRELLFNKVYTIFHPDIVHIHGTEYAISLEAAKACGEKIRFVVSIQGLISYISNYYLSGISSSTLTKKKTLRDFLRKDSPKDQQMKMKSRGIYEQELLARADNIIGRTSWDRSCTWAINPSASYYVCNETMRPAFYKTSWSYETCIPHSIFLSQANYPIKGAHILLKALPLVIQKYPDTKVFIAGHDIIHRPWYRMDTYGAYLLDLIKLLGRTDVIHFLGVLEEAQMAEQYAKANVFVCPSSIENSPNSVGEAQLVGTPVIASYVGGTMDLVNNEHTGLLYRFEEYPLLALHICRLFESIDLCKKLSINAKKEAIERHNGAKNAEKLRIIYKEIISK